MKRKKGMLVCMVMLIIILYTGIAEAAPLTMYIKITSVNEAGFPSIMYMKEESYSYSSPKEEVVLGVYGKNEKIKITGKEEVYYITDFFGTQAYIHEDKLTSVKPKYSYTVKSYFKELKLKEKARFSSVPQKNGKKVLYEEDSVYTIGQTKYWYKVFVHGEVAFIRKNNDAIISVDDAKYPVNAETERMKYKLSLLSKKTQTAVSSFSM